VIKIAGKANNAACKSTSTNFEFFIFSSPVLYKNIYCPAADDLPR
tara:strand:- start:2208 stop:2342 length:135 start_codon:yes stop_codon:yes gene_type:complete